MLELYEATRFVPKGPSLATLAVEAAAELERYVAGEAADWTHVETLRRVIGDRLLPENDGVFYIPDTGYPQFPYLAISRAMRTGSDKNINQMSQFALEMKLLHAELSHAPELSEERARNLRDFYLALYEECDTNRSIREYCPNGYTMKLCRVA